MIYEKNCILPCMTCGSDMLGKKAYKTRLFGKDKLIGGTALCEKCKENWAKSVQEQLIKSFTTLEHLKDKKI